ncbi:MAG: CvpA family protein [Nevskia sp.]|nr:CvpA family protein [Nevskia sp.]
MVWVDYVFIGIVLLSVLVGALRGFVREALSLATWVLAVVATLAYGPVAADHLQPIIGSAPIRALVGRALVFLGALLAGGLVIWLVGVILRGSGLAPVDRMVGSGFGLLRGAFIVVALVMLGGGSEASRQGWWQHSVLVPQIQPFASELQGLIPPRWLAYLEPPQAPSRGTVIKPEK